MSRKAIFSVLVGGSDIAAALGPFLLSIDVRDGAGTSTDTATIVLDDAERVLTFPTPNAQMTILLGFEGAGMAQVFSGTVDEVRFSLNRGSGSNIEISAKGIDTGGKVKEPQNRHWDGATIGQIMRDAGATAGVGTVRIDEELGAIVRPYENMNDESFLAFGERIAGEIGGTFKIRNDAAVMVKKGAQRAPGGQPLPQVIARRGDNLIAAEVSPYVGRHRYSQIRVRYYDAKAAQHDEVVIDTDLQGVEASSVGRFTAPDRESAVQKANSLKAEAERGSSVGNVQIDGNPLAQPEAPCALIGVREGIDGVYIIDGVGHRYDRGSGYTTQIDLAHRVSEGNG
jgi:uncharacterized protein